MLEDKETVMQRVPPKWNAEDYAKNSSAQLQWGQELISKLALQGCESVLDIGCGDGKISAQLALAVKNGKVLGIDLSEDMIRFASTQFPAAKYPNLSFQCMDAASIQLSDKFDIAFSSAALHWVKNHLAILRGVHTCLKVGGKILFQMGGRGNVAEIFHTIKKIIQQPRWKSYYEDFTSPYHFYGPEKYEQWLLESRFCPVRVELVPKDMQHYGIDSFRGWLRTTWFPYTDQLPTELRNTFLTEVIEAYMITHPLNVFGNIHVKVARLEVEAYTL